MRDRVFLLPRRLLRRGLLFAVVFLILAAWRVMANSHGFLVDDSTGLDWVHRTFMLTTVYTCGSTFICNVGQLDR